MYITLYACENLMFHWKMHDIYSKLCLRFLNEAKGKVKTEERTTHMTVQLMRVLAHLMHRRRMLATCVGRKVIQISETIIYG